MLVSVAWVRRCGSEVDEEEEEETEDGKRVEHG